MHVFSLQCSYCLWKMSQNRGYRRDGRQSYQMNASAHYGGRSGQQMNVNPWEAGLVPGGRSGVAGLLPTPPQTNLLSQLSSPEAQLALASNLLSTLLRPQQQAPQVGSSLYMAIVCLSQLIQAVWAYTLHTEPCSQFHFTCSGTLSVEPGFSWSSQQCGKSCVSTAFWLWSREVPRSWPKQA
jgi:hypothetical protein